MDIGTRIKEDLQPRSKRYDPEIKLRILDMFERGNVSVEEITESFGITKKTIYNWRNAYKKDGLVGLEDSPRSGKPPRVTRKSIRKCIRKIKDRGLVTVKKLRSQISRDFYVRYSENFIWRIIDEEGLNYKKTNPVHARAATNEEIEEWAKENIPRIRYYLSRGYTLMASDEVHPEMDEVVRYGYAAGSQRIYSTHHGNKQRINIIGAITSDGDRIIRTQARSNSATFMEFLDAVYEKFGKVILLIDRASYHTSKVVLRWFDDHPDVVPIFLPVGSPHMNAIENFWGMMHAYLRNVEYYTFEEFKHHVYYFLRNRKFNLNVRARLNSRLDENAEAQVLRTRKHLKILESYK